MSPPIPADFPVRPWTYGDLPAGPTPARFSYDPTCGYYWDDTIATAYTPAPSGRCPFEAFHVDAEADRQEADRLFAEAVRSVPADVVKAGFTSLEVKLTATVADTVCHDVLTTAYEGGISYWAMTDQADRDGSMNVLKFRLREREDDEPETFTVDTATVRAGIKWLLEEASVSNSYHVRALIDLLFSPDQADYDADTADLIVQAGLFGELRYG